MLVMAHNTIITETLDPLQFAPTHVTIAMVLHTSLFNLDKRNTYVRMLFINYSSAAFNTSVLQANDPGTELLPLQLDPGLPDGQSTGGG
jgi:hypothetical protein